MTFTVLSSSIPVTTATTNRSVRFRSSATAYFNRTYSGARTSNNIMTLSVWVKRGNFGITSAIMGGQDGISIVSGQFSFTASDQLNFNNGGASSIPLTSTAVFRDFSAWYHLLLVIDTTQATAANRVKMYVNGVAVTSFSSASYPALNANIQINIGSGNTNNKIGSNFAGGNYFDGYMAEFYLIDGQALTPSSFGQYDATTGAWGPIAYTGTYGNNGFYLNFRDNSASTAAAIGKDSSGNGNNWTPNNISVTSGVTYDSMLDYPALSDNSGNGIGNYAVFNPLWQGRTNSPTNGNLDYAASSVGIGTMDVSQFLSYWEITSTGGTTTTSVYSISAATTVGVTTGLTYGFRFNSGTGALDYTTNGSSFTSLATGLTSGPYFVYISTAAGTTASFNAGQRPFAYSPPSGYKALNTYNLPTPTILNGAAHIAASTYTGTGAVLNINNGSNNALGTTFKPDVVWIKTRSAIKNNIFFDSIRGTTNYFITNATDANTTNANTLTTFGSTGFTLGSDASAVGVNVSAATYVGWQWLAGAGSTSSNTSGTITSTVSVNATAGFSVVSYTGTGANATIGHGLNATPSMVIVKHRNAINSWQVYSMGLPSAGYCLQFNGTAAQTAANAVWNGSAPTFNSNVFSVGTDTSTNASAGTYIAYCWSAVAGYSAFGKYTGNGSADGPFIYCGFRPRFVLVKCSSASGAWCLYDTSRSPYNTSALELNPNANVAETSSNSLDILSNGFKWRDILAAHNTAGATYIYAAFAENPFKYSNAR